MIRLFLWAFTNNAGGAPPPAPSTTTGPLFSKNIGRQMTKGSG